jgi:hypothetical protein
MKSEFDRYSHALSQCLELCVFDDVTHATAMWICERLSQDIAGQRNIIIAAGIDGPVYSDGLLPLSPAATHAREQEMNARGWVVAGTNAYSKLVPSTNIESGRIILVREVAMDLKSRLSRGLLADSVRTLLPLLEMLTRAQHVSSAVLFIADRSDGHAPIAEIPRA